MRLRGFELIHQFAHQKELLPQRETAHAAGYDLKVAET
ncbi:dUTP diphosphatase, partial [Enterococcus faecalis]|nr:dUTP diphosphatase [Enterococcus faecalis]